MSKVIRTTLHDFQYLIFFALVAMILSSCAQLGLPQANTFSEKAAVAYGTVTQVREMTASLLVAKKITSDDAQNVQQAADVARAGIDTARKIHDIDPTGATAKLEAVRVGLTALMQYLSSRQ